MNRQSATRAFLAVAAVVVVTAGAVLFRANATTAGFLFLLVVLFSATAGGLIAGVCAALAATAVFNYFFLPPAGTFHIADPANWIALGAFLVVSILASRLVAHPAAAAVAGRSDGGAANPRRGLRRDPML